MQKNKQAKVLVLGALLMLCLAAPGCLPQSPYVPMGGPPPPPPPPPDILIEQEPADRQISNTIGETRIFSVTTSEPVTVIWRMVRIRSGPRMPPAEREEALPSPLLRPEPVPEPPVRLDPLPRWDIGQDINVTLSEVRISAPEVGHLSVTASAEMVVDGELRSWSLAIWDWEVEEEP